MCKIQLLALVGGALACSSCTRGAVASPAAPAAPSTAATARSIPGGRPVDAGELKSTGISDLKPLAEGKKLRLTKLEVSPVEITVPAGFKLSMEGGEDSLPVAYLVGPDLTIDVKRPESRISTLEQEKRMLTDSFPRLTFVNAYELQSGFLLVMRDISSLGETEYATNVFRPDLHLFCGATDLKSLEEAYLAASICLTLRRVAPKRDH